jgi:8-oxo-dGTP pyrophosphatase MutT (NUDIX family)
MRYDQSAGAIVYYMKDKGPMFLLLKYPTYWGFSKGIIEKGEEPEQTAIRELEEETGISVDKIEIIPGFTFIQNWMYRFKGELIKKKATYMLVETSKETSKKVVLSSEHEDFQWLDYEDSLKIMKVKNNKEMLKEAYEFIKDNKKQSKLT